MGLWFKMIKYFDLGPRIWMYGGPTTTSIDMSLRELMYISTMYFMTTVSLSSSSTLLVSLLRKSSYMLLKTVHTVS